MARFIIITFAFMGWAFYEMSGGADFEPASARLTNIKTDPLKPTQSAAAVETNKASALTTEVTRVSLNLTSVDDVLTGKVVKPANLPQQNSDNAEPDVPAPLQGDGVAIIPSLIEGADASNVVQVAAVATQTTVLQDVRIVTGNRVNVRGGPGTDYGVVARLVRGDEVEILEDNGNGWVRLQSLDDGSVGWMADFLLSN